MSEFGTLFSRRATQPPDRRKHRVRQYLCVAQILSHVTGMAFNYFTYSRHVFRDSTASKRSFLLAYLSNYLINLGLLAIFSHVVRSAYVAGLAATLAASLINYLALRAFVFRPKMPSA